jgi:hypothetical protein
MRVCLRENTFAARFVQPIGTPGARLVLDVDVSDDPTANGIASRAAVASCEALVKQQPEAVQGGRLTDPRLIECLNNAVGAPPSSVDADNPEVAACMNDVLRRRPELARSGRVSDPEVLACVLRSAPQR